MRVLITLAVIELLHQLRRRVAKHERYRLRELRDDLEARLGIKLPELSMGMSGDCVQAVEEGATLVRVGGGVSWDLAAPKNKFHNKQADIWLIGKDFNYDALSAQEIDDWYRFGKIPKDAPVYHTETNKNTGKYELGGIPEGQYFLVILDSYGRDAAQNLTELDDKQQLQKKLPNWDAFELFNVGPRSCLVQMVTVKRGETVNIKPGTIG